MSDPTRSPSPLPAAALASLFALLALLAPAAASAQACTAPPPGLIAWYPGERHSDDAAGFFNGTRAGDAAFVEGMVGEAFAFDGAGDHVGTQVSAAEQRAVRTFSYELWARPTAALGTCPEASGSNCSGANLRWAIFPVHGDASAPAGETGIAAGVGVGIGTNGVCVGEHSSFLVDCLARLDAPISDWTHIVAVVEDRTPRIYVDGVLVRTGVASGESFVFASWEAIGSGFTLGEYAGELDEVSIYDRALTDAEIAALFAAGADGKCRPACARERSDDAWNGAEVTSTTGLRSSVPDGMFGASGVSPEPTSTLFADSLPDGTEHRIEWRTEAPVRLAGFGLSALHDTLPDEPRAFRRFRLEARDAGGGYATLYDQPIVVPYGPATHELDRCVRLRRVSAQEFRATFTQDGPPGFSGPRVLELDADALPDLLLRDGFEAAPANDD